MMMMTSLFLLHIACSKTDDWNTVLESKKCRSNPTCAKTKDGLLLDECLMLQSRSQTPRPKERGALIHFCDALTVGEDATSVACGLPACADLAEVDPQAGLNRLIEISLADAKKKSQQKAIVLGLMRSEDHLDSAIKASIEAKRTSWFGLAIAEADCGSASTAKQINQPCAKPMPNAAKTVFSAGSEKGSSLVESLTAFNLALALNPKLDQTMAELATSTESDAPKTRAAAQALRVHFERSSSRTPEVDVILNNACQSPTKAMIGLCQ